MRPNHLPLAVALPGVPQTAPGAAQTPGDASVLPLRDSVSGSEAARTMQEPTYSPQPAPQRLPEDAPNVLTILLRDTGPALASTFGGTSAPRRWTDWLARASR